MDRAAATAALCVALDVPDSTSALALVKRLTGRVGIFKIGMELFTSEGPDVVRRVIDAGGKVFLDLKFHDIPNTVAGAARSAARLGVAIFNVHASGGPEMLRAALQGAAEGAASANRSQPQVIAVTVLTSLDQRTMAMLSNTTETIASHVLRLATLTREAGLAGVVASPEEITTVRERCGSSFLIVTPGIRPVGTPHGDQRRVMSPAEAIRVGTNIIVVGRPITAAKDPAQAAEAIVLEIMGV